MRGVAALALVALVAACGGSGSRQPTVFAAASLTEVFQRLDPQARFDFAGSDELAFQIEQGAVADVYAAASPTYPERLYAKGIVRRPRAFASNELVLIVPKANPANVRSVADLGRRRIKLVLGEPTVPIGAYTREALAKLGETRALRNVVSEEPDVKGVTAKVALGEADAGFVYATDARAVAGKVTEIRLPQAAEPKVRYLIAVVRGSRHRDAAEAFVDLVLSARGQKALRAAGFGRP